VPAQAAISPRGGIAEAVSISQSSSKTSAELKPDKLTSTDIPRTQDSIQNAIATLTVGQERRKVLLVLDAPDLLLALQPNQTNQLTSSSTALHSLILSLSLHEAVHSTVLNLSADVNPPPSTEPPSHVSSPLATESQAFLVGIAHQADLVIGCRGLDTGGAGDVSGVIRITTGNDVDDDTNKSCKREWKEQELLYMVRNDGVAKVWERGASIG
jgi:elongator complex protein 6